MATMDNFEGGFLETVKLAARMARRELSQGVSGFVLFLCALGLGVAMIALVLGLEAAINQSIQQNARTLLGGDVELRLTQRPAEPDQLAYISENSAGLSQIATLRAMVYIPEDPDIRSENTPGMRHLVEIKAVDSFYPLFGHLTFDPASDQDHRSLLQKPLSALISQPAAQKLGMEPGDIFELGAAEFTVTAIYAAEPDANLNTFELGPGLIINSSDLAATDLIKPGSLVRYRYRLILPADQTFDEWKENLATAFPQAGWRVRGLDRAAPSLTRLIDRVGGFMALAGLAALVIGGVGAANAVRAFLRSRAASIAILKCLGAPARLIFTIYLFQTLALSGLGILLGLIVGSGGVALAVPFLNTILPIALSPGPYPLALALAATLGLTSALLFMLWPLGQAATVSGGVLFRDIGAVRLGTPHPAIIAVTLVLAVILAGLSLIVGPAQLMGLWFIAGFLILFALFWAMGQLAARTAQVIRQKATYQTAEKSSLFPPTVIMALSSLARPGGSATAAAISLGLGMSVLAAVSSLEGNLQTQLNLGLGKDAPRFFVLDVQPDQLDTFQGELQEFEARTGVPVMMQEAPLLRGRISRLNNIPASEITPPPDFAWILRGDRGITWSVQPPGKGFAAGTATITDGEWWPETYGSNESGQDDPILVSFDAEAAEAFNLAVGDTITINLLGREIEATIANLRLIEWETLGINFVMVFSPGQLQKAPQTYLATLSFPEESSPENTNLGSTSEALALETDLEQSLSRVFPNVSLIPVREALARVSDLATQLALLVRASALVSLVSGLIVLAGALSAEQARRQRESIILKTIGATRRQQLGSWLIEYGFLAVFSALLAGAAGSLAAFGVLTFLFDADGDYQFQMMALVWPITLALLVAVPFGLVAGLVTLGKPTLPYLRNA